MPHEDLGYHLCYGDAQAEERHFKEPDDTSKLVAVASAASERAARPLDWFSMPVPIGRDDDAYFEPLSGLHHKDGVAGTQRRIDTALRLYQPGFGVATECGMARKPREHVRELLEIQAQVHV